MKFVHKVLTFTIGLALIPVIVSTINNVSGTGDLEIISDSYLIVNDMIEGAEAGYALSDRSYANSNLDNVFTMYVNNVLVIDNGVILDSDYGLDTSETSRLKVTYLGEIFIYFYYTTYATIEQGDVTFSSASDIGVGDDFIISAGSIEIIGGGSDLGAAGTLLALAPLLFVAFLIYNFKKNN